MWIMGVTNLCQTVEYNDNEHSDSIMVMIQQYNEEKNKWKIN